MLWAAGQCLEASQEMDDDDDAGRGHLSCMAVPACLQVLTLLLQPHLRGV